MGGNNLGIRALHPTDDLKFERRVLIYALFLPLMLLLARETIAETVLVTNTPTIFKFFTWVVGLFFGALLAYTFWKVGSKRGFTGEFSIPKIIFLGTIMIPAAIVTSSYLGRWAFEITAFTGWDEKAELRRIKLIGVQGGKSGTFALLKAFPDDREFKVVITEDLYIKLASIRPPLWSLSYREQLFCMNLRTGQGRWGAVRAHVPARWADGLNTYSECELSRVKNAADDKSIMWSDALEDTLVWPTMNTQ